MAAARVTLRELVAQKVDCLDEVEVWCLLSEAALSLLHVLDTDPSSWVDGPSLPSPLTLSLSDQLVYTSLLECTAQNQRNSLSSWPQN